MKETPLSKWLNARFLKWQSDSGRKRTTVEFAKYLGLGRGTVTQWMDGARERPKALYVQKLAEKLGPDLYDVLGLARPEPADAELKSINDNWERFAADAKRRAIAILFADDERRGDAKPVEKEVAARKSRKAT
jgi:transcriptional regulator with XRE-family HTH domain